MAMHGFNFKTLFYIVLALVSSAGSAANAAPLLQDFYVRPLVRLTGYASLLAYSLLMLRRARYNSGQS
jgi:hypothetical protein